MRLLRGGPLGKWQIVGQRQEIASKYDVSVGLTKFVGPHGQEEFSDFRKKEGVTVLPLTRRGTVLLVRQFKQAANDFVLEFPAGLLNMEKETVNQTAARELEEETGYRAGEMIRTSRYKLLLAPRKSASGFHTCLALKCREVGRQSIEIAEDAIEVWEATLDEMWSLVRTGELRAVESRECALNAALAGYIPFPQIPLFKDL